MDAEAYPEASRNVLQILWHIGASIHGNDAVQLAKTRASAFEALSQYEVNFVAYLSIVFFKTFLIWLTLLLSQVWWKDIHFILTWLSKNFL